MEIIKQMFGLLIIMAIGIFFWEGFVEGCFKRRK